MRYVRRLKIFTFALLQSESDRIDRIVEMVHLSGPDDRRRDALLMEKPCQRNLRRFDAASFGCEFRVMNRELRERVWTRAGGCCEYCRMPQAFDLLPFELDHIIAEQHHGETEASRPC